MERDTTVEQAIDQIAITYPALTGSEKQIAWATDIRARALDAIKNDLGPQYRHGSGKDETLAEATEAVTAYAQRPSAKWWIDHRGMHWAELTSEIARER